MEDYIDFPCSDTWLDWYNEQGLTPRRSGRPRGYEREFLRALESLNRRLEMQEKLIQRALKKLYPEEFPEDLEEAYGELENRFGGLSLEEED